MRFDYCATAASDQGADASESVYVHIDQSETLDGTPGSQATERTDVFDLPVDIEIDDCVIVSLKGGVVRVEVRTNRQPAFGFFFVAPSPVDDAGGIAVTAG